jgi:nicotinate-nucleotide adenylyltransferase
MLTASILSIVNALLGGTFDPPHYGHLAVANAAVEQLHITRVEWVPAGDPWQKTDIDVTDARLRLAMTQLAAAEDARFVVSDIEVRREGHSYTIDTVEGIGGGCILILGADAAAGMRSWHRGDELLDMVEVAVVERPGVSFEDVEVALGRSIMQLHMPSMELSGTAIRAHVAEGYSPRFFVPDAVSEYILANHLYQ